MMKRRWSNNGGFALRMLEESSSEVTSSSAGLVMSAGIGGGNGGGGVVIGGGNGVGMTLSPTSLGSPEYGELELWYDDNAYNSHSVIASAMGTGIGCTTTSQTGIIQLPPMPHNSINHTPRSTSANSISSGTYIIFFFHF